MAYPEGIDGLTVEASHYGMKLRFSSIAGRSVVELLVDQLPWRHTVSFYDVAQNQVGGDPGVYHSIVNDFGQLRVSMGNHGWSSSSRPISREEAVELLTRCLSWNTGPELVEVTAT